MVLMGEQKHSDNQYSKTIQWPNQRVQNDGCRDERIVGK